MKKKLLIGFSLSITPIIPLFSLSCSQNQSIYGASELITALQIGDIVTKININSTEEIKITTLDQCSFSWEIKKEILDDPKQKDYVSNLKDLLKHNKIKFLNYFLPKLNEDGKAQIVLEINENNVINDGILVENILTNDHKKFSDVMKNLTAIEIKELIDKKLNQSKSYISDLDAFLNLNIVKPYQEYKDNQTANGGNVNPFDVWWTNQGFNEIIKTKLEQWFYTNFQFFNPVYKNVFIKTININVENNDKVKFNFEMSTSKDSNDFYTLKTPITLYLA